MPLVTFFSVLERPEKNRKGGCTTPHGLNHLTSGPRVVFENNYIFGILEPRRLI